MRGKYTNTNKTDTDKTLEEIHRDFMRAYNRAEKIFEEHELKHKDRV